MPWGPKLGPSQGSSNQIWSPLAPSLLTCASGISIAIGQTCRISPNVPEAPNPYGTRTQLNRRSHIDMPSQFSSGVLSAQCGGIFLLLFLCTFPIYVTSAQCSGLPSIFLQHVSCSSVPYRTAPQLQHLTGPQLSVKRCSCRAASCLYRRESLRLLMCRGQKLTPHPPLRIRIGQGNHHILWHRCQSGL